MTAATLTITADDAGALHDGLCRAVDQGLRITDKPNGSPFVGKVYWTVDSVSTPGMDYIVMVDQRGGEVACWCECDGNRLGRKVCKHIALCLSEMGLIPRTTGEGA